MSTLQFKALAAVTATGAGAICDLGEPMPIHSMQVILTGAPTAVVALQGSLDGTNFSTMTIWDSGVQSSGDFITASAFAATSVRAYPVVRYIRANVTTLSGGTSPTVTAYIASCGGSV